MPSVRTLTVVAALLVFMTGCNYFRTFPLYSELYVESPEFISLKYLDDPKWWDYSTLSMIRQRVETYYAAHPNTPPDVAASLRRLTVRKGMDSEQVTTVLGPPGKRHQRSDGSEVWIYDDRRVSGVRRWYYSWGKLQLDRGVLVRIEVQYINIHK